jgi:hypothetical protein
MMAYKGHGGKPPSQFKIEMINTVLVCDNVMWQLLIFERSMLL